MPDQRRHRGPHPDDLRLFGADALPALRTAAVELAWLLMRGYAHESSLKLVGDRHGLESRQRLAVSRWTSAMPMLPVGSSGWWRRRRWPAAGSRSTATTC